MRALMSARMHAQACTRMRAHVHDVRPCGLDAEHVDCPAWAAGPGAAAPPEGESWASSMPPAEDGDRAVQGLRGSSGMEGSGGAFCRAERWRACQQRRQEAFRR